MTAFKIKTADYTDKFLAMEGTGTESDPFSLAVTVNQAVSLTEVDTSTDAVKTIDYPHAEIHSGSHYNYLDTHTLLKAGVIDHMVVTPNTDEWCHFVVGVSTITSSVLIAIYEAPIYSATGTLEPIINRNRNFPDDNTTLLYEEPILTDVGTRLSQITLGAGRKSDGGSSRDNWEMVLKQNTAYLIRVTELNVAKTVVNIVFDWYEHTNE